MSLYNMVVGTNPLAGFILYHLQLKIADIGRFRDACFYKSETEGHIIRMLTRLGGNNRLGHADHIKVLTEHPMYLRDNDDPDDSTYATFFFKIPETMQLDFSENGVTTETLDKMSDNSTLKEKLDNAVNNINLPTH